MNPLLINTLHGGQLYSLLYLAAFLTSSLFFIISGLKNKYSFQLLWLISATSSMFFILGNKLFAIAPGDWNLLITDPALVSHGAKTILGGLIGVIISSILLAAWFRADIRLADSAAIGLPLSMAVTRLGCLYSGCCYGKPTHLPWGIQYGPDSHAFDSQHAAGLISPHDLLCLPVHPVQVYDIICCILIAVLIWKFSGFLKARGNKFAIALMLYGVARFFLEFLRDPATTFYGAETFLGIKLVQWAILAAILLMGTVIMIREKRAVPDPALTWPARPWKSKHVVLLLSLWMVYLILFHWFDVLERMMIGLMLIPALVMMAMNFAGKFVLPQYRLLTSMLLLSCLLFMSQTYSPVHTSNKLRYFEVGAGGTFGKYYSETAQILKGYDCNGNPYYYLSPVDRLHSYSHYGINASYNVRDGAFKRMSAGLNGFYGTEKESYALLDTTTNTYDHYKNTYGQFAINPYLSYDLKNFGFDIGFHAGNFRVAGNEDSPTTTDMVNAVPTSHFYPQFGLRLGPQHILYLDAKYCGGFPTCFPENKFSIGLASGLGFWNGVKLGAGYSTGGYYVTGTVVIKDRVVLDIKAMDKFWSDHSTERFSLGFGLRYRFGFKLAGLAKND